MCLQTDTNAYKRMLPVSKCKKNESTSLPLFTLDQQMRIITHFINIYILLL